MPLFFFARLSLIAPELVGAFQITDTRLDFNSGNIELALWDSRST
jgi:hypothetical protein